MVSNERDLLAGWISEAKADEVGLWMIVAVLRERGFSDPGERRSKAMEYVRRLLESGEVVAAEYRGDSSGYAVWDVSTPEAISRIDAEWDALGHEPMHPGEIAIFVHPSWRKRKDWNG